MDATALSLHAQLAAEPIADLDEPVAGTALMAAAEETGAPEAVAAAAVVPAAPPPVQSTPSNLKEWVKLFYDWCLLTPHEMTTLSRVDAVRKAAAVAGVETLNKSLLVMAEETGALFGMD